MSNDVVRHHDDDKIGVNPTFAKHAWIDQKKYQAMYEESINQPDLFWGNLAF